MAICAVAEPTKDLRKHQANQSPSTNSIYRTRRQGVQIPCLHGNNGALSIIWLRD